MPVNIRSYRAGDSERLFYRHFVPETPVPRARVVALHGIQSHSGWYIRSNAALCAAGYEVFALDRRGSGMNESIRGHARDARQLVDDVALFLDAHCRSEAPDRRAKCVLLAVSWGGKLAACVAAKHPEHVGRLALLYPGLKPRIRPTWYQELALSIADRLGVRKRRRRIPLEDPALFTSDPGWQQFIRQDPLAVHEVTIGFLLASRKLDAQVPACVREIRCPTLLMLAGGDQIIDNEATRRLFDTFGATEKTLIEYPLARHTLEFEPGFDRFTADLLSWLDRTGQEPA